MPDPNDTAAAPPQPAQPGQHTRVALTLAPPPVPLADLGTADLSALPPELAAKLPPKHRKLTLHLVAGSTWAEALDAERYPAKHTFRTKPPPQPIQEAASHLVKLLAQKAGVSRTWIVEQLVGLYVRAVGGTPVLSKAGAELGVWRMDGPTAARCLQLLGEDAGMFKRATAGGFGVGQVADLLRAVGDRAKPALEGEATRATYAAPPQAAQVPDPAADAPQQGPSAPA